MKPRAVFMSVLLPLVLATGLLLTTGFSRTGSCPAAESGVLMRWSSAGAVTTPRWSGCFGAPVRGLPRSSAATTVQVQGALASFEIAAQTGSHRALQNFGVALALAGDGSRAITTLMSATAEQEDADALSNLAAGHLLQAARSQNAYDLALALNFAGHALAVAPRQPSGLFNQALALTALGLDDEGDRAWREYLRIDQISPWSEQARRQLAALERRMEPRGQPIEEALRLNSGDAADIARLCVRAAQTCREQLEDTVLPAWARARAGGDLVAADAALRQARLLGDSLRQRGDELDADAVADLDRAIDHRERRLEDLEAGIEAYGRARAAFENDAESVSVFTEAEHRLSAASSPLLGWARAHRIHAEFNTYSAARLKELAPIIDTWAAEASSRGYVALAGRLLYLEALDFANRTDYGAAEPLFASSIDALQRTGERDHLAATYVLVADARMRYGESHDAWEALAKALGMLRDIRSPRRRYVILLNAGVWMNSSGLPHAALRLLSSARDTGLRSNQTLRIAESSLYVAKARAHLGYIEEARADLEIARPDRSRNDAWARIERARYEYLAGVAEVEATTRPDLAIPAASGALTFFESRGFAQRVASLLLIRGRAYKSAGQIPLAEADFASGIETYLRYRSAMPSAQQRLMSQETVWDLYEERLALALTSPLSALAVAEQSRARTLLELLRDGASLPIDPAALQPLLGADQRVLYYAVIEHELLVWVIGPSATTFARQSIERAALERTVAAFVDGAAHVAQPPDWKTHAEHLFDLLIKPVESALGAQATVIVIPDGVLNRVPFAALLDRRSGQFLIETHPVATAPSATMLATLLGRAHALGPPGRVLAVGNPTSGDPGAVALEGAERETQAIARLYAHATLISRAQATTAAFIASAPDADVVHFAGHAVASFGFPLLAHLELAHEEGRGSSALEAEAIAGLHLERTRLVVLAACRTASGEIRRGEGVLSLARPFLIAGVSTVVAALWDIDDATSAQVLTRFHERFAQGVGPARALRDAQVEVTRTLPPASWSGFVVIGTAGPTVAR
jgi:CHAT domain-containing protein